MYETCFGVIYIFGSIMQRTRELAHQEPESAQANGKFRPSWMTLGYFGAFLRGSCPKLLGSGSILDVYGMNKYSGKNQTDIYSIGIRNGEFGPSWVVWGYFGAF